MKLNTPDSSGGIMTAELSNGIRIIHQQDVHSAVFHVGLFVNVGSRDESEEERGIAHFLEHVLFKGTKKRKAYHILTRLDVVGGELNAYTTKEETVVYASVLNHHLERAVEIIADITFNSVFPAHELEKEKEVVLDEIASYKDSPSELIFEDFDDLLFRPASLANDILGTADQVNAITGQKVKKFVDHYYQPQNMVIASVGNFTIDHVVKKLDKYFGGVPKGNTVVQRKGVSQFNLFQNTIVKDIHQSHAILGGEGCSYTHEDKTALVLLNNYLGGPGMNSRLNMLIREKHGYAYSIDSSVHSYTDTGIFTIYFGSDKKNISKTIKLIKRELLDLCNHELSALKLHQAKEQLKGFIALGMESNVGLMLGLGKTFLVSDKVDTVQESLSKIDAVNSKELLEVANKYFNPNKLSELIYTSK